MTENDKNWKKFQELYSSGYLFDPKEDKEDLESEVLMAETTKEAELMLRGYILNEITEVWQQGIKAFTEFDKLVDRISTTTEFKLGAKPVYKTDSWVETQSLIAMADVDKDPLNGYNYPQPPDEHNFRVDIGKLSHIKSINSGINDMALEITHIISHLSQIISDASQIDITERKEGDAPF